MTELSPAVRALLAEAGAQHDPSSQQLDRGLDALHATLAFSAPLIAASAVSASASSSVAPAAQTAAAAVKVTALQTAASAFSGGALVGAKAVKLYLVTAAVIGSVGTVAVWRSAPAAAPRARTVESAAERQPDVRMALPVKAPEQVEPSEPVPQPVAAPAPRAARAAREADIGAELALIEAAQQSLQRTQPSRALGQLEQHARSYPRGLLASEREALRAIALCEAGRGAEGRKVRDLFLARAGSTPIAERVRKACR
jgi:hypothetical protein